MPDLLTAARARTAEMVADTGGLVRAESPTADLAAVRRCADAV
ncbi:M20 family peptidase, partial [Actinomadura logoneensis]